MPYNRQKIGKEGETLAVEYLESKGYKIIERNYRTRHGEIDIIAADRDIMVFVEVKTRNTKTYGDPKQAVTYHKQKKISQLASLYLKQLNTKNQRARFDVISVKYYHKQPEIEHLSNAFELVNAWE